MMMVMTQLQFLFPTFSWAVCMLYFQCSLQLCEMFYFPCSVGPCECFISHVHCGWVLALFPMFNGAVCMSGLEFGKSQRAVEKRAKWRKLVAKSSVVLQWPSWLRDRWVRWEFVLLLPAGAYEWTLVKKPSVSGIAEWLTISALKHYQT